MSDETPSRAEKLRAKKRAARRKRTSLVSAVGETATTVTVSHESASSNSVPPVSATIEVASTVGGDSNEVADIGTAVVSPTDDDATAADGRASDLEEDVVDDNEEKDEERQMKARDSDHSERPPEGKARAYDRFRVEQLPTRIVARVLATLDLVSHLAAARSCVALDAVSRTQDAAPRAAAFRISDAVSDFATLRWLPPRLTFVAQTLTASRYALASVLRLLKRHQLRVRSRLERELRKSASAAVPTAAAVVDPPPPSLPPPPIDCLILRDFRVDAATSIRDWPLARELVVNASAPDTLTLDRVAPKVVRRMWRDLARRRDICKLSLPSLALSAGTFEHSDFSDSRSPPPSSSSSSSATLRPTGIPSPVSAAVLSTALGQRDVRVRSTAVEPKQWTELESESATATTTAMDENGARGGRGVLSIATLVMGDIACEPYECAILRGVVNLSVRRALRLDAFRAALDFCRLERLMLRRVTVAALDCVGASRGLRRSLHTLEVDFDDGNDDDGGSGGRIDARCGVERVLQPICVLESLVCLRVRRRCDAERSDAADWRALETLNKLEVLDLEGVTVDPLHSSSPDPLPPLPPPLLLLPHLALLVEFRAPHGFLFSDLYVKRPAVAAAAAVVTGSTTVGSVRSESKRSSSTEAAVARVPDREVDASETKTERSAASSGGPLDASDETDAVVVAAAAAPAPAPPTDGVAGQQALVDQNADSYRLAFPRLRDLYCRAPYRSCPIGRPKPPGTKRRGAGKKRASPSPPPRYAIHINDIPPHAHLRAVHVGDNLVSVDDLDQLVTCVADDYPRLRCIFGARHVQRVSDIPYSDRDSGTYFSLSDD